MIRVAAPDERGSVPRPTPTREVAVDRTMCTGRGVCAQLAPQDITLDEWGYPLPSAVRVDRARARALVRSCPVSALFEQRPPA